MIETGSEETRKPPETSLQRARRIAQASRLSVVRAKFGFGASLSDNQSGGDTRVTGVPDSYSLPTHSSNPSESDGM